jgi:hypothetical protein
MAAGEDAPNIFDGFSCTAGIENAADRDAWKEYQEYCDTHGKEVREATVIRVGGAKLSEADILRCVLLVLRHRQVCPPLRL